jgi:hypothetical protein
MKLLKKNRGKNSFLEVLNSSSHKHKGHEHESFIHDFRFEKGPC